MRALSCAVLICFAACETPAGTEDGSTPFDAGGVTDAGAQDDAGTTDAGLQDDAGAPDAGSPAADAGTARLFVFTGSGNGQIRVFAFDERDGGLTALGTTMGGSGTSFLAPDVPRRRLYAVNEGSAQLAAFALEPADAGLTFLNRVSSGGNGPAHLSVDGTGQFVFAANYGAGTVAVLPVTDAGLAAPTQILDAGVQAHQIFADPGNRFVYAPCKGSNHLAQYAFAGGQLTPLSPPVMPTAAGAGPRHLALHPTLPRAYLINELDSTLQTLAVANSGAMTSVQTLSTLPAGFSGANTTAEVAVHPNGRFVFGSNRGHNSIVTFAVDATSGQLTLLGHSPTGGNTPRHFSLDPSGRWLIGGNQGSNSVFLFSVDPLTGALTSLGLAATVTGPSYVGFVDLR